MGYWVSVVTPQSKGKYRHMLVDEMHRSISWNYSDLLSALPCGYERDWQGMQAADLTNPVYASIVELNANPKKYEQYEKENGLGTIETCREILQDALRLFREHPDCIVVVE